MEIYTLLLAALRSFLPALVRTLGQAPVAVCLSVNGFRMCCLAYITSSDDAGSRLPPGILQVSVCACMNAGVAPELPIPYLHT